MPTIIQNEQQIQALDEINNALNQIKGINTILGGIPNDAELQIALVPKSGRGTKVSCAKVEEVKVLSILSMMKHRLVKEIKAKSTKFRVDLSDEDLICMGGVPDASLSDSDTPVFSTESESPHG